MKMESDTDLFYCLFETRRYPAHKEICRIGRFDTVAGPGYNISTIHFVTVAVAWAHLSPRASSNALYSPASHIS
jgi:hypothetical protein